MKLAIAIIIFLFIGCIRSECVTKCPSERVWFVNPCTNTPIYLEEGFFTTHERGTYWWGDEEMAQFFGISVDEFRRKMLETKDKL
jgi:hypothetical protein